MILGGNFYKIKGSQESSDDGTTQTLLSRSPDCAGEISTDLRDPTSLSTAAGAGCPRGPAKPTWEEGLAPKEVIPHPPSHQTGIGLIGSDESRSAKLEKRALGEGRKKSPSLGLGGEDGGRGMENWAPSQLELSQAKENRMEESKGRESKKDPSGEGS